MTNWDFVIAPTEVEVKFKVNPAIILVQSLQLISQYKESGTSGLHSWVAETADSFTPEQKHYHAKLPGYLSDTLIPIDNTDFRDFLNDLEDLSPETIRDSALIWLQNAPDYPGDDAMLNHVELFVSFIRDYLLTKRGRETFDEALWREIHATLLQPVELKESLLTHLQSLWNSYLSKEWKRSQAMLYEAVAAYNRKDFSGMTAFEAVEAVTGRDMRGNENMVRIFQKVQRLIFIPSPHIGPYVSWRPFNHDQDCILMFGARLPKGVEVPSSALNRNELLVWLNALADDTRLKMLELLFEREELCAQDFIDMLDLSQSSASRHLRQLTASGFLKVRRKDVNKCYTLNRERIEDTMTVLGKFLHK